MIPQAIPLTHESPEIFCGWLAKWGLSLELGERLQAMQSFFPWVLKIFSGRRTPEQQDALRAENRMTAPNHLSTHLDCPTSTGADLIPALAIDQAVQVAFGLAAFKAGLRWGGGSAIDPATGIPLDWKHVDLGPRNPS